MHIPDWGFSTIILGGVCTICTLRILVASWIKRRIYVEEEPVRAATSEYSKLLHKQITAEKL